MTDSPPGKAAVTTDDKPFRHLSTLQLLGCLAVTLGLFFFDTGPLWRHPWDMGRLNGAILSSYAPIPILVAGCLLWSRRFSFRALFLDTLSLTLLKYVVTFSAALVLWNVTPAPPAAPPAHAPSAEPGPPPAPEPAIAPTPIDPAQTGTAGGTVVDAMGRPIPGALVYVSSGLSGYVFAPPEGPVTMRESAEGVTPVLAVAMTGQKVLLSSTDTHLHTATAKQDGEVLFNVPLLRTGEATLLPLHKTLGIVILSCNVHPTATPGRLVVLSHPFHAWSDAEGRFQWRGVPAGHLKVAALREDGQAGEAELELTAGGTGELKLVLGR